MKEQLELMVKNGLLLAPIKFSEFAVGGVLRPTDEVVGLRDDANTIFNQALSAATVVYVSQFGSDSTGNGSVQFPYQTISFSNSQITDASPSKPYLINAFGVFTDTDWNIKPDIYYNFNNGSYTVTNQAVIDPSWSAGGTFILDNLQFLTLPAGMFLNFHLFASPFAVVRMSNIITQSNSDILIAGNPTGVAVVIMDNILGFQFKSSVTLNNCYGAILDSALQDFRLNHTANGTGLNFSLETSSFFGTTLIEDSTTSGIQIFSNNNKYTGSVTFNQLSSGNINVNSAADSYFSTLHLQGAGVFLTTDVLGVSPIFAGGASPSNITINARKALSGGSGISYDPVTGIITNTAIVTIPDASYGEMYFSGNVTPTTIVTQGVPVKVDATYNSGDLLNFNQAGGTLTCTNPNAIEYSITVSASGTMTLATDTIQLSLYLNGVIVPKSAISYALDGISPSFRPFPIQCGLTLVNGDTVEIFIANLTSTNSPTVDSLNCFISSVGGSNNLADQVVVSWDGLTTATNVTAGPGISITGGMISATGGGGATLQTAYDAGTGGIVLSPIKPLFWQSDLTTTVPQTLYYQTDISDITNPISFDSSLSLNSDFSVVNYQHKEVFILNYTAGSESSLINLKAMNVGSQKTYYTYDGLNDVTEINSTNTNVSNQLNVGPNVAGVNFTLGTTLLFTSSYLSGVFTSVWNTLSGTNVVLANSLAIGQTVEIDITGQIASAGSGGTGIIQFAFGSFAVQSQIINFNGFSGQKNMSLKIKVTRVDSLNVSCSVGGWFNSPTNIVTAIQMIISPSYLSYNAAVDTPLILQWGPTFSPGSAFDFLAKNLNIIQYS